MKLIKYVLLPFFVILISLVLVAFGCSIIDQQKEASIEYSIVDSWQMPEILDEISGISWVSNHEIACIQDEDGYIFIYDIRHRKVSHQIKFAGNGDYEGIALRNNDAYIMESNGTLYEVLNLFQHTSTSLKANPNLTTRNDLRDKSQSKTYKTKFSSKNNMEALFFDPQSNVFLTIPKETDLKSDQLKKVYEIRLSKEKTVVSPRLEIEMNDKAFKEFKKKKIENTLKPSDIAIHPTTGEYYILEGARPKIVILNKDGLIKRVYTLDHSHFPQPEGITFSPAGTLYIATEAGKNTAGMIHEVEID